MGLLIVEATNAVSGSLGNFLNSISSGIGDWGLKLVGGIASLFIGLWLIRIVMKGIGKAFDRKEMDASLRPFLLTLIAFSLKILLFITIAGIIGVPTASFAALIAGVGIAIGAAFNGSLGHLASGVMILIFRPFKIGDLIEVDGTLGIVKEISVFVTILETFQNKTEIIPNGTITDGKITNVTAKGNLRVDMPFNIRYGSDIAKAQQIMIDVMKADKNVMSSVEPTVVVNSLSDSSIELLALPYAEVDNYFDVFWGTRQAVLEALVSNGYEAPFAQRVVTMKS